MIRLAASAVVAVLANAVGLVVGAMVLEGITIDGLAFAMAVGVFTLVDVLIEPLLRQIAVTHTPALLGSSALIATLVSLVVTATFTDGLSISGLTAWVLGTVLVWGVTLGARLLLPLVIFKKALSADNRRPSA